MSIILLNDPFDYFCPSRSPDPVDVLSSLIPREVRHLMRCPAGYSRTAPSQRDFQSTSDKEKFQVNLDVQQFKPEEISVKVFENTVTVEGKHEEKEDEHGFISRHFVRRYVLPEDHDIDKIESKLSSDGVLTITAPKLKAAVEEARSIPVIHTRQPMKAVDTKQEQEKK